MIGVFDSGVGGLCAYYELRRLLPRQDIIYLADRKNAPCIYSLLDEGERQICLPIIKPAAVIASKYRRVLVIATERTVSLGAFGGEISALSDTKVKEIAAQELVSLVEEGNRDGKINEKCVTIMQKIKKMAEDFSADALILGCTHFSHLENEFKM